VHLVLEKPWGNVWRRELRLAASQVDHSKRPPTTQYHCSTKHAGCT
jgi:hypothetical protein